MRILIRGCYFWRPDMVPQISQGDIALESDRLLMVGEEGCLPEAWRADKVIEGGDHLCLPGLVNCHTHAAMTLLRSYADDMPLMEWLEQKIWPVEGRMTAEDAYWGSMLAMIEMIRSGTTTFSDMYFFMDETARAAQQIGIRACLSRGLVGTGGSAEVGLTETRELLERWQGAAGGRIMVWVAPHAPFTCPPAYMGRILEIARYYQANIHIHLSETSDEVQMIEDQYGKSPVAYLNDLGVFEFPVLAAHCVHLSDQDIEIMSNSDLSVAHNPESNMKLASGIAPVLKLRQAGIPVGLGTDGASSNNNLDLIGEMRTAAFLHKLASGDPQALPAGEILQMATNEGARALRLGKETGSLKPGYKADLILLDLHQPHLTPRYNLMAHTVYAAHAQDVDTVIIDGRMVMEKREILTVDEEQVMAEVERCARRLTA
jgi:5-methylthioadenosine/S-adenosylhomocysteine deaminase